MLTVKSAQPDPRLKPFIARYVARYAHLGGTKVVEPVVARLGTMLEFMFADPYVIPIDGCNTSEACDPLTVIGPITIRRVRLVMQGDLDSIVVLFRPLGLYRLFRMPIAYFAERGIEGQSAFGSPLSKLREQLGNTSTLDRRKEVLDAFFLKCLSERPSLDPRGTALRRLMSSEGPITVSEAARQAGISNRQLERMSIECAGVPPKMLTRVARFERAIQLHSQHRWSWMRVAHEAHYHDQMHMVRDFRRFAGATPALAAEQIAPGHLISLF